ncbi:efflux RND transporter periplasmic adaptor subunit [Paracoccus sp. Ld10]|uniref:efflux RND transporter periplasmic adaptor subunit n=1 Tax=Paracoccus sp. Ld10 TaxID=649158 RepID=UPI00386D85D8
MRFLALATLLALACGPAAALSLPDWLGFGVQASAPAGPPRPVVSVIVDDRDVDARWIPGVVEARTQVQLGFQTLGRMIARPVDLGDQVAAGDLLAQLSTDDLAATTRAAGAALDAADVQNRTALAKLERTQALAERNVASDAQLEQAQQEASAAAAAVEQARSQLLQAEDAEGLARMTAPFAGVVSAVFEAPGAVVGAGAPVVQLSAQDTPEVVIDLPEQALVGLAPGAEFTVWHRTDTTVEIAAVLDRVDPMADSATRTRRLYLSLPPDAPFRLGALVRARFGSVDAPSLSLPAEALVATDGLPFVWRVIRTDGGAQVEQVPVQAAAPFRGRVSITHGLDAGDEIVIRGVKSLAPGQPVGRRLEP